MLRNTIFLGLLVIVAIGMSNAEENPILIGQLGIEYKLNPLVDKVSVPNVMLRVVYVTPDWIPFSSISGWTQAVPLKESEVLKYYEVAIWQETSSVHLYEFPNDYDTFYGQWWNKEKKEWFERTDAEKIAYREQFLIEKYTALPDVDIHADERRFQKQSFERSLFLKTAFMDIVSYLVNQHPSSEHHLAFSGHGGPGGRLFSGELHADHANAFLKFWSESLGKPLGVIDMGGPCDKGSFEELYNFSEYARYYIASDLPNGGYTMDDWTFEKYHETDPDHQYHNLFAANKKLKGALIARINLYRKRYEYSRNYMINNQVSQANYLYSCEAFRRFSPNFIAFFDPVGVDDPVGADLYQYMIENNAPQRLIEQFNDVIVHKADNKDFFEWSEPRHGILMPYQGFLDLDIFVFDLPEALAAPVLSKSVPEATALFANYPNPFNPETWIPYQLSKPASVTLTIYDIQGHVVRALDLGHQRAGLYKTRSRAAYWDGRNQLGEPVTSSLYFYTLTAGDFTATRKMLIRK